MIHIQKIIHNFIYHSLLWFTYSIKIIIPDLVQSAWNIILNKTEKKTPSWTSEFSLSKRNKMNNFKNIYQKVLNVMNKNKSWYI